MLHPLLRAVPWLDPRTGVKVMKGVKPPCTDPRSHMMLIWVSSPSGIDLVLIPDNMGE
jgi:hypothetical protein